MKRLFALLLILPSLAFGDGFFGPYVSNALSYTWTQPQTFTGGFSTPSATITGGTINGVTIGGSVAAPGAFTSLASAGASFSASAPAGSLVQDASGNLTASGYVGAQNFSGTQSGFSVGNIADSYSTGFEIYGTTGGVNANSIFAVIYGVGNVLKIAPTGNLLLKTTTDNGSAVLQANGPILIGVYTVAGLPACASGTVDDYATVSDASATPTYWGTATGGGATHAPVFCSYNGTTYTWVYH